MKNKLVFRILGALASALIIVAVFVPFISVTGYTASLWGLYSKESIYLPIMIIAFGSIGVIFFALNIKTEFAYMSVGAIAFFIVMRTVDILNQGTFNTLNVGYYFLVVGTILTGIMAFLANLKSKDNSTSVGEPAQEEEKSILTKIDNLYENTQNVGMEQLQPSEVIISPIDPNVQPLPVETSMQIEQPQMMNPAVEQIPVQPVALTPISEINQPIPEVTNIPEISQSAPVLEQQPQQNPVVQEFNQPAFPQPQQNLVVQEFNQPAAPQPQQNPVVQEFNQPAASQPEQNVNSTQSITPLETISTLPNTEATAASNPVVEEFTNQQASAPKNDSQGLEIFGQGVK